MKSSEQKERELIIKLHNERKSSYQIANILGISQTKASFWIRRYRKTGSLENKPRSGRPTPLTKNKLGTMSKLLKSKIFNSTRAGISSKEVLQLIEQKTRKKYTLRHTQRLLRKMGFSLITPRISHIRKDKQSEEKFKRDFKKNFNRNIWTIQS